jgi:16S rRNA (uracil1498-N3)-methyltransferase
VPGEACTMIRIFLPPKKLTSDKIVIDDENARYLSIVLRTKPGEIITIFDGSGQRYICRILQVQKKEVIVEQIKNEACNTESPVAITLAQGLPKSDKMDLIVQKSTELGVSKIVPLITERSQVRHTHKAERWRKIALSASQQSGRVKVPVITDPENLEDYLSNRITPLAKGYIENIKGIKSAPQAHIIFSEEYGQRNLKQTLAGLKDVREISLLIGPEGGFSRKEVDASVKNGFLEASLGPRILRAETAPIAAISIIQYELGDIG